MKLKKKMKTSQQAKYVSLEKENNSVQKENVSRKEKEGKSQLIWQSCIITIVIEALRSGKQQEKYWRL